MVPRRAAKGSESSKRTLSERSADKRTASGSLNSSRSFVHCRCLRGALLPPPSPLFISPLSSFMGRSTRSATTACTPASTSLLRTWQCLQWVCCCSISFVVLRNTRCDREIDMRSCATSLQSKLNAHSYYCNIAAMPPSLETQAKVIGRSRQDMWRRR